MEQIGKHKGTTLNEQKDQAIKFISIADMRIKFYITDLSSWMARNQKSAVCFSALTPIFTLSRKTNCEELLQVLSFLWMLPMKSLLIPSTNMLLKLPLMLLGNTLKSFLRWSWVTKLISQVKFFLPNLTISDSRKISKEEAYSWGKMLKTMKKRSNIEYSEISALNGTNVDLVLQEMGEMVKNHVEDGLCLFGQQVAWFWQKIESKDEFL